MAEITAGRQSIQKNRPHSVSNANPDNTRSSAIKRLKKNEVFVLSHKAGIHFPRLRPNLSIGAGEHSQIADMMRFMTFRREPARERRRKIRVDEKFHWSEAARTG